MWQLLLNMARVTTSAFVFLLCVAGKTLKVIFLYVQILTKSCKLWLSKFFMIFLNNERFRTSCVIYLFFLRKTIRSIDHSRKLNYYTKRRLWRFGNLALSLMFFLPTKISQNTSQRLCLATKQTEANLNSDRLNSFTNLYI